VSAFRRPVPEPELEPEKEDVNNAPNIAVVITVQLGVGTRDRRTDSDCPIGQVKSTLQGITLSSSHHLHYLHHEG
jgi:hypothetical protein